MLYMPSRVVHDWRLGTAKEAGSSRGGHHTMTYKSFFMSPKLSSCVQVEGGVLGSPSLAVRSGPVYVKQHWTPTRTLILVVRLPVSFIILYPHFHLQNRFALTVERVPNTLAAQLACRPILSCYLLLSSFPLAAPVFIDCRMSSRNPWAPRLACNQSWAAIVPVFVVFLQCRFCRGNRQSSVTNYVFWNTMNCFSWKTRFQIRIFMTMVTGQTQQDFWTQNGRLRNILVKKKTG